MCFTCRRRDRVTQAYCSVGGRSRVSLAKGRININLAIKLNIISFSHNLIAFFLDIFVVYFDFHPNDAPDIFMHHISEVIIISMVQIRYSNC